MAESNTFTGVVSGVTNRSTYQMLTSDQMYEKYVQWACFNKNPFMKAVGLEAFGVQAVQDIDIFGAASPSGRIIEIHSGVHSFSGPIFATAGTSFHVGRMSEYTPELVEGGDQYAYAYHQLVNTQFIPENDVDDNGKGPIDIKAQKMEGMKQAFVRDINYCWLGNSSAPDTGTLGPSAIYADLPNLISVTQSRTVGNIATTNSFWQNGYKAITSVGGGGELDRPISLQRGLIDLMLTQMNFAEATLDYLLLCTQGFWQYYWRLANADVIQGGALKVNAKYDGAGINHFVFEGQPMVWDPAVTVPYGATASTECCYGIHIPSFKIAIRSEKNFSFKGWEPPRQHDSPKAHVATLDLRSTPAVTARRPHFVAYNVPACAD